MFTYTPSNAGKQTPTCVNDHSFPLIQVCVFTDKPSSANKQTHTGVNDIPIVSSVTVFTDTMPFFILIDSGFIQIETLITRVYFKVSMVMNECI